MPFYSLFNEDRRQFEISAISKNSAPPKLPRSAAVDRHRRTTVIDIAIYPRLQEIPLESKTLGAYMVIAVARG